MPLLEMDSNDKEEDFPTVELDDPVWYEEPIPDRQQLCIHLIPHNTPRSSTPSPQAIQEEHPDPNKWMARYWMTCQMSSMFLMNFYLILTLRHTVYSNTSGKMTF